jgi:hypothetical protein
MEAIMTKCNNCDKEFEKLVYEITRKKKLGKTTCFCSLSCATKYQQKQQKEKKRKYYLLNPNKCLHCDNNLSFEHKKNRYCNQSCSAKHNNKNRMIIKNCLFCNKQFNPHRGNIGKFCNHQCSANYQKRKVVETIVSGNYKSIQCQTLKKYLIKTRGHICESCGLLTWLNQKIVLTIEHKDGDATNNKLENVQLLCWNCHSLTPTFGGKNKNSTRIFRRDRYLPVSSNTKTSPS